MLGGLIGLRRRHQALLLLGLAAGVLWALPIPDVARQCPPHGEGYGWCVVQKAWLPHAVLLVLPLLFAQLLAVLLFRVLPSYRAHRRAGERLVHMTERQERPPYARDPFLLAASWGERTGRGASRPRVEPNARYEDVKRRGQGHRIS